MTFPDHHSDPTTAQVDVAIIGGGISGLSAAYYLKKAGYQVRVLEAGTQVGGVIQSKVMNTPDGPVHLELGPNTLPSTATQLMDLIRELSLPLEAASPAAKKRFIYWDKKLHAVSPNPLQLLASPLLSPYAKWRLLSEWTRPVCSQSEMTLGAFITHRFGEEVLNRMVTPAITGIYASDPNLLSLQASFPFLAEWEQSHGSVLKGAMLAIKNRKKQKNRGPYQIYRFPQGLQQLPLALAQFIGQENISCRSSVTRLNRNFIDNQSAGYCLSIENSTSIEHLNAEQVILATPAYVAASLLKQLDVDVEPLTNISYAAMMQVHLGFKQEQFQTVPTGFGFLVPRGQSLHLLGSIWGSSLFPGTAPQGYMVASHFQGGSFHPELLLQTDDDIIQLTLNEIRQVYQNNALSAVLSSVVRWPQAIPQYTLGHQERIQAIESQLTLNHPGCYLLGNYLSGVSLNDCLKQAQKTVEQLVKNAQKKNYP